MDVFGCLLEVFTAWVQCLEQNTASPPSLELIRQKHLGKNNFGHIILRHSLCHLLCSHGRPIIRIVYWLQWKYKHFSSREGVCQICYFSQYLYQYLIWLLLPGWSVVILPVKACTPHVLWCGGLSLMCWSISSILTSHGREGVCLADILGPKRAL